MDTKKFSEIIDLMKDADLTEFEIEEEGFKLRICREGKFGCQSAPIMAQSAPLAQSIAAPTAAPVAAPAAQETTNAVYIKSPMVGTFYRSPSPESRPFVDVGSSVDANSVTCIIEAMKVMNEIHAELSGTILEILVHDGETVEYGQNLFKVKP